MKNESTHTKTKDYSDEIERWEEENVLQLAHHFHKLNTGKGQFERTSNFSMNKTDAVVNFNEIKQSIKKLRIYMALNAQDKSEFTFFPVLQVLDVDDKKHFFKLNSIIAKRPNHGKSEVVPELFKNIICKNWDTIDINLIDDLFTARTKSDIGFEATVRVKYYEICDEIIEKVIKKLDVINGITLYSGIDMNKFSDKYQISFTPVLGFEYENKDTDNETFGLKGILEFSKGKEVFIEYTSPCPPTC
ncbi:hypothetical protein [Kordia sp.]|uniref:hypothetical protein n=1 Tax=Kordia sp. TaxID=1965332 RepID=UPI003D281B18